MKLLLTRLSALGDIIHTWPLASAIKAQRPDWRLGWVVEEPFRSLVDGHPAIDEVITVATRRWRKAPLCVATRSALSQTRRQLRLGEWELAIDSQGTVKSAAVCYLSKAERRLGLAAGWRRESLAGPAYTETFVPEGEHVVDGNLSILEVIGLEAMPGRVPDGRFLVGAGDQPAAQRLLVGAGREEKILPVSIMVELARRLAERAPVEVLWGPGERERAARVAEEAGVELAPKTDIPSLAGRLASSTVVIGVDTGPLHLAASLGVPVVAVFLCTDPRRNGPKGERVRVVSAVESLERPSPGSSAARRVRDLAAEEILDAVTEICP